MRVFVSCALALLASAGVGGDAPEVVPREAIIQELLQRSRLLEDAHFRVARPLYEQYVRESLQPAAALRAPVAVIAEEGLYALSLPADRKPALSVTLRLRAFIPEQCVSLPVLSAAWAWEDVRVNGQPAKLATDKGWLRLAADAAGEYRVSARLTLREVTTAGGSLALDVPSTVRTLVTIDSPDAWEFAVEGAARPLRGEAGGTRGQLAVSPRQTLRVSYGPVLPVTERPPRFAVRGDVAWNIDAALQQVAAELDVAIIGGSTDRLDLAVPASAERLSIGGPDVREAQVGGGKAVVFLRGKVAERTRLRVSYEMPLAKGAVQRLEGLGLADGHWAGGTLVVTNSAGGIELLPGTLAGLRQIAMGDVAESARAILVGTPAVACEIASRTWSAEIEILDLGEFALKESIADLAHYEVFFRDDGMLLCKASYEIRNRARQFLRLDLPRGAKVLQARVNEEPKPLSPVPDAPDAYLLPLVRSLASVKGLVTFPVDVVFLCRLDGLVRSAAFRPFRARDEVVLPLPRIDLPIAYAWCEAYVPDEMKVRKWTGPLAKVERYSNETATASMSYGLGLAAEGYKPKERPIPPAAAPAPEKPKPAPKPAAPHPPTATREPGTSGLAVLSFLGAGFRARAKTPPAQPMPQAQPPAGGFYADELTAPARTLILGRNYYRAGKDFYEKGDLTNAAMSLEQAIALNPKSQDADNARKLLDNIKLVQPGPAAGVPLFKSQTEKAGEVQVKKQVKAGLKSLEQQQQEYVEKGLKAAREGKGKEAQAQLGAAKALGEQLLAQGANKDEVESRLRNVDGTLQTILKEEQSQLGLYYARVEDLKKAGRYAEALDQAKQLQRLDTSGATGGGKSNLQREIEDLAVKATRQKSLELAQRRPDDGLTAQAQGQVRKQRGDLQAGWDVANGPVDRWGAQREADGDKEAKEDIVLFTDGRERPGDRGRITTDLDQAARAKDAAIRRDDLRRFAQHALADRAPDEKPPAEEPKRRAAPDEKREGLVARVEERRKEIERVVKERRRGAEEDWQETQAFTVPYDKVRPSLERDKREEEWERRIKEGLKKKVTFDFVEKPLPDALSFLSDLTGTNVVLDPDAALYANKVTLRVKEMEAGAALDQVLRLNGLSRVERDGALFVSRPAEIHGKRVLRMYDVTDLTIDIKDFQGRRQAVAGEPAFVPQAGAKQTEHEAIFGPPQEGGLEWRPQPRERARPVIVFEDKPPEWEKRIREALKKKVTFDFVETPLQDAINFLQSLVEVTIVVDTAATKDAPDVTLRVGHMELGQALNWIMKLTGLAYTIKDEAVFISKPEHLREPVKVVARIYDVTRLVDEFKKPSRRRRDEEAVTGPTLAEFVKKTIAPGTWDEPGDAVGYAIEYRAGKLLVTHTTEVQNQVASLIADFQRDWTKEGQAPGKGGAVTQSYDVRDLVRDSQEEAKKLEEKLREATTPAWGDAKGSPYTISYRNGRIVVVHTPEVHHQIEQLMNEFRTARGPQVEVGQQITLQKASGKQTEIADTGLVANDPAFQTFVRRNYDWSFEARGFVDAADRGQDPDDIANFGGTLAFNLGQKVQVNGINLNVAEGEANGIGVSFSVGNNDLSYAVVDEAQLRTLLELDAAKKRGRVAANPNAQETIVGTDALLSNDMRANVRFAGDTGNTLDINGNPIQLPHQKYILINNGDYLTAVQANPMQHWTDPLNPFPFAVTAPEIEVPRVGQLAKFEKTLVEPGDELVLRASYRYSR